MQPPCISLAARGRGGKDSASGEAPGRCCLRGPGQLSDCDKRGRHQDRWTCGKRELQRCESGDCEKADSNDPSILRPAFSVQHSASPPASNMVSRLVTTSSVQRSVTSPPSPYTGLAEEEVESEGEEICSTPVKRRWQACEARSSTKQKAPSLSHDAPSQEVTSPSRERATSGALLIQWSATQKETGDEGNCLHIQRQETSQMPSAPRCSHAGV